MDPRTSEFVMKLREAFCFSGVQVFNLNVAPDSRGGFVVQAVLGNGRRREGIEDAKIVKKDYRIEAIAETEKRQATE